nr:fimbrial protein [Pseudomonas sp. R5(2019)]
MAASLAGTSAFANTGTINFEGRITSGTCAIEIVNPTDGTVGSLVKMGTVNASQFTGIGQEYNGKAFILRVKAGSGSSCTIPTGSTATVTFSGIADTSGDYFAINSGLDVATGVAISLRDNNRAALKPGVESAEYDLVTGGETDLRFNAYYRSTAQTVTAGIASADVGFVVAIK